MRIIGGSQTHLLHDGLARVDDARALFGGQRRGNMRLEKL